MGLISWQKGGSRSEGPRVPNYQHFPPTALSFAIVRPNADWINTQKSGSDEDSENINRENSKSDHISKT